MRSILSIRNKFVSVVICVSFMLMQSCGNKNDINKIDPAFAGYVISFTSGVISNTSKIRVRLVEEVPTAVPGEVLAFNPFSFSPNIKGKARWLDKQTIEFTPETLLSSGELYTVDFELGKFIDVPKNLRTLTFSFRVIKQAIQYEFNGMSPYKLMEKKWQKVHGIFNTADFIDPTTLEKAVEAKSENEDYKISWEHSKDGRTHHFTIENVERKTNAFFIKLLWDGDDIGVDDSGKTEIEMPGLNDFKVIHVKTKNNPKSLVEVFFSDPLSKKQDMKGLFMLNPSANEEIIVDGNIAQIIPTISVVGDIQLSVFAGVKNIFDEPLGLNFVTTVKFMSIKPQVELIGEGVIIPNTDGIFFPFKAVSLSAVDVKIIQIFENNIVQFLQVNQLNDYNQLKRVGRVVYSQEVQLTSDKPIDYGMWNVFSLDLSKLIKPEPGAIYRVQISFRKKHSLYACSGTNNQDTEESYVEEKDVNEGFNEPNGYWDDYEDEEGNYYNEEYNWDEKENPCSASYYMYNNHSVARNVLASDFGIIAKAGSNLEYHVAITDLRTAKPLSGIDVEFRNYQNQVMTTVSTNSDGMCKVRLAEKPFVIVAKEDKQRGYLRLDDASSLSLSMFDIKGEELKKGVKGFIYGERGVWRPGDMIYLTFILEDKNKSLPVNHPVVLELYNPMGQLYQRLVKITNINGFYDFSLRTQGDAPTGNWTAKMVVGGSSFSKNLRIETVKPNRMKINLDFGSKILHKDVTETGKLQVNWLHGAPARNAKISIDATIAPTKTEFDAYKGYIFDDPSKSFTSKDLTVFKGSLNNEGAAVFNTKFDIEGNTPGMVAIQMKTLAFDAGGESSVDREVFKYSPYSAYVGVRIPEGKGWNNALYSNEKNIIPIVLVDENGKGIDRRVKIEVFNVYWRWWWDESGEDNLANYVSNEQSNLIKTDYVSTKNGKALYEMNLDGEYWGRMLIKVTDFTGGHSTGAVFYSTYRGWWSNAGSENPGGAEMLMFNTDKKQYKVGEDVSVELPVTHEGRALISIETGSKVLKNYWFTPKKGDEKFKFEVTPEMAPNIYIHVSYIQPHNHSKNDFPIRMYGVQGVSIENAETHLTPIISMKNELKPEEKFIVSVKEAQGKPMTYTIAIVDDGLLDLTKFKTPNPWDVFYAHEALGVRTWDLYKYVVGAYAGQLAGLLAIGGDENLNKNGKENTNRFKPVVLFKTAVSLKSKETKAISFKMPNYVGSVRVMVVAGNEGAYGSAEKTVPVRQALMVLPTLPRMVSPTEIIKVPVTVFAMEKSVKNVTVNISPDKNFEILDGAVRQLTFNKTGDQMVEFKVRVKDKIAQGKIVITATSGAIKSSSETNLQIRMPNPPVSNIIRAIIKPGETWSQTVNAIGIQGTNSGTIEISRIYPINLEKRLQYLIQYPHGCIEQITSAAFPQLFLQNVMNLSDLRKLQIETNVNACLTKLKSYQLTSGGFSYWPDDLSGASEWGTNYAGHFMLEAQSRGYQLPVGVLDSWLTFQTTEANNWQQPKDFHYSSDLIQAYRLYTLALAQKPAESAMNRMLETKNLGAAAKWRLAAAYAIAGKPDIANNIINAIEPDPKTYDNYYYGTYGSTERDQAMMLETLVLLKKQNKAEMVILDLAKILETNEWLSTQSTAYMLLSISKFIGNAAGNNLMCDITINGIKTPINSSKPIYQSALDFKTGVVKQISIRNTSKENSYVNIYLQGVPLMKEQEANSENLIMAVRYFDMKGNLINPVRLKQGTEFYADVTVQHPGIRTSYNDLAIQQMFPSGWEIVNTRMDEIKSAKLTTDIPRYEDIRDDRVYMYFDLDKGQKKVFRVLLQAAYLGSFYMPSVYCEAMYDNTIHAQTKGQWVEVVR